MAVRDWLLRLREWGTIAKLTSVADLLFKITTVVAALAAANFFYFRPEVRLQTNVQPFIDLDVLRASTKTDHESTQKLLTDVAGEYNHFNSKDLKTGGNATVSLLPPAELCSRMTKLVERVFDNTDCSAARPVLGRGRYYERLLLDRNDKVGKGLDAVALRDALLKLRAAEYLKARCFASNVGNARATKVQISASDGFVRPRTQANDPFVLAPDVRVSRDFETARGALDEDPEIQFGIDWTRAGMADSGLTVWAAAILIVAFVLVLINDFVRSSTASREVRSEEGDRRDA